MSKLLVIFGATGQQGGSVADYVVDDPELSKQYTVRAVTRDPSKPAAQALQQKGIEVVKGDMADPESLKSVLQGAHTIFALTNTWEGLSKDKETEQGKNVADAAVEARAKYLIWSSLPNAAKISNGKLQHVTHFDAKADVEDYIRSLPIRSSFYAPAAFMQNFQSNMSPQPTGDADGSYAIFNIVKPETELPLIDIVGDSGKFVGAILAEPDKYEGKFIAAAIRTYSFKRIAEAMSKSTGKTVKYIEIPEEKFRTFLPSHMATEFVEMLDLFRDYGYYGPQQEELVSWAAKQARGKLTTLDEYLANSPLKLE